MARTVEKEQIKCKTNREKFYLYNELSLTTEYYYPLQNTIMNFALNIIKLIALMKNE